MDPWNIFLNPVRGPGIWCHFLAAGDLVLEGARYLLVSVSGVAQTDGEVESRSGRGFLRLQLAGQRISLGVWDSLAALVGEENERCG